MAGRVLEPVVSNDPGDLGAWSRRRRDGAVGRESDEADRRIGPFGDRGHLGCHRIRDGDRHRYGDSMGICRCPGGVRVGRGLSQRPNGVISYPGRSARPLRGARVPGRTDDDPDPETAFGPVRSSSSGRAHSSGLTTLQWGCSAHARRPVHGHRAAPGGPARRGGHVISEGPVAGEGEPGRAAPAGGAAPSARATTRGPSS